MISTGDGVGGPANTTVWLLATFMTKGKATSQLGVREKKDVVYLPSSDCSEFYPWVQGLH